MTSKKPAASKRANLPRASDYTKDFLKDWQRLSHSGRYDIEPAERGHDAADRQRWAAAA